jgi:hypothetical protein
LVPLGTRPITTINIVFGNAGTLPHAFSLVRFPKFIAGRLLPCLPFFVASQTSLSEFFKNISTHDHRIHSALVKVSNGSQVSNVIKQSPTTVFQFKGSSRNCFKRFCPGIID